MANAKTSNDAELPDWWQREKQRRQLIFLVFLCLLLLLIGYYYLEANRPKVFVGVPDFDPTNYVAFVRREKDNNTVIYAIRADGNGLHRLTDPEDKSDKETPVWAPDGKSLFYVTTRKDGHTWQIYTLGSGDPAQFTYGAGNKSDPVVSPDGKSLAFIAQGAIKTTDLKGNEPPYQVMPPPSNGEGAGEEGGSRPSMDPSSSIQGPFRTAAISSDGRGCAGVKDVGGGDENVDSPPDMSLGNEVAFAIPPGADRSIFLNTGREVSIAWDPTGPRLACAFTELAGQNPKDKTELVSAIVLWDFTNPAQPTSKPLLIARGYSLETRSLAWSPDGSKLAFEGWRAKSEDDRELRGIAVMTVKSNLGLRIDNGEQADAMQYLVAATPDAKPQNPVWSPDGSRLLYEATRTDGKRDLWVVNSDGTDPINLTKGQQDGTDNYQGAWSPVRSR